MIILNTKANLTKFDFKSSEGVFIESLKNNKAYWMFNLYSLVVEKSINL